MGRTVTVDEVDRATRHVEYINRGTLTICVCTMPNGFMVVGTSGCADPAKYDQGIGEKLALTKVWDQVWMLLGYTLRDEMHREEIA
jgi:hypothetical protein